MNKTILAALILVILAFPVLAQDNLGARPMGMGGAFVGLADDVNAIFINPAGVTTVQKESVLVSNRILQGREYTMLGGVEQTPLGSLGIGYVGSTDPIASDLSQASWDSDSPVKYSTQTLYVTMAESLNNAMRIPDSLGNLSLGVNVKFSSRKIDNTKGLTTDGGSDVDIDLATIFKPNDNLSLGLSLQNFLNGPLTQNIANPTNGEAGGSSAFVAGISGKLFGGSVVWSVEGSGVGCEWQPVTGLAIRAGRDNGDFTSGLGLNLGGFSIDYAYVNSASPVHYWSVSFTPPAEVKAADKDSTKTASVLPDNI